LQDRQLIWRHGLRLVAGARLDHPTSCEDRLPYSLRLLRPLFRKALMCKLLKIKWSGRVDSNHRPPGPEPDSPRPLLDYRATIFARNFILSTTFVGGQLGGQFSTFQCPSLRHCPERSRIMRQALYPESLASRFSGSVAKNENFGGSASGNHLCDSSFGFLNAIL